MGDLSLSPVGNKYGDSIEDSIWSPSSSIESALDVTVMDRSVAKEERDSLLFSPPLSQQKIQTLVEPFDDTYGRHRPNEGPILFSPTPAVVIRLDSNRTPEFVRERYRSGRTTRPQANSPTMPSKKTKRGSSKNKQEDKNPTESSKLASLNDSLNRILKEISPNISPKLSRKQEKDTSISIFQSPVPTRPAKILSETSPQLAATHRARLTHPENNEQTSLHIINSEESIEAKIARLKRSALRHYMDSKS